ncbi:uncharacterized protein P174DRAFT_460098 [Aspergillus novofumigatus IBT 16806]|uniref:Aminoglycoside phosphotransferase domain-containing protein n=1 Tax=Aspergillus novofumigatus (strain IBT 16806) TaxID=1392255 RepID=A0A2I1C8M8_ASPN1|nr:uncharacterized protein P174DRAFT_460098 [Aspergillus novofumigatus IBT 16806]PKX93973.1 hypothetical protein P174DRAFT_460098 [Aspergillus novofumigatus IBT 16806]
MSTTLSEIYNPAILGLPPKDVVEAHAQVFFRQKSRERNNSTIRIPEVYHAFEVGGAKRRGYTYIVMEYIDIDLERSASDEQRARALSESISIPPPPGVFGSFTGGTYRHHFFRDSEPPVPFSSAAGLEDYLNRLDFSTEPLLCYYADMHPSNFPIDKHGQLWVIDFDQAGVLPSSFMNYAIAAHPKKRLPVSTRKTIPLPKTSNLGSLGRATYVVKTIHNDFRMPELASFG